MSDDYRRGLRDALRGDDSPRIDDEPPQYWAGYSEGMRQNHVLETYHYAGPA